ncbi:autophagy-related protein 22-like protein [Naematelia encephala]|uniref:Autophagy-related protein n=1 Tax=Naematelia encephala TaxID=71784 RepID=A0A1Y2ASV0_9TREE|nr:autophagy-related protein 22-like protein [Naematelia encephala]
MATPHSHLALPHQPVTSTDLMGEDPSGLVYPLEDEKNLKQEGNVRVEPAQQLTTRESEYPVVGKWELFAYYCYNNGANGIGPNGYSATQLQNVLTQAGYEKSLGVGAACALTSATCMVPWAGGYSSVSQIVLIASGLGFMCMTLIFITIGSSADYDNFARWLLMGLTVICWGCQFGFLGVKTGDQWQLALGLYIISFVTWGAILVFYGAQHPVLARHTQKAKDIRAKYEAGDLNEDEYAMEEMLERSNIMTIAEAHSNWGYLLAPVLSLSVQLPLASSNLVNNYVIAIVTAWWVALGLPWFFMQKNRPGPPMPPKTNHFTLGFIQIYQACKQVRQIPYTFLYLVSFFFLADGLNTTGSIVSICQNDVIDFSFLDSTYLNIVQAVCSLLSIYFLWWLQLRYKIHTKWMFAINCAWAIIIPFWGMIGMWTDKIGFHHVWEFWLWNVIFGLTQASYYNYSFVVMGDLCPPGFEGMFFGIFGLSNRASSIIGPNVTQKIISHTGVNQSGFAFCFALVCASTLIFYWFVDYNRGIEDAVAWSKAKRGEQAAGAALRAELSSPANEENIEHIL